MTAPLQATDLVFADIDRRPVRRNRAIMLALVSGSCAALVAGLAWLLSHHGWAWVELAMLLPFALALPYPMVGLWNALIGFWLIQSKDDPASYVTPQLLRAAPNDPIIARTAIAMAIRNESAAASIANLATLQGELAATGWAACFEFHVLSDSDDPNVIEDEERAIAAWRQRAPNAAIGYRRRADNSGYKGGNIAEFVRRCHDRYDFFLPLDADSVMGAGAVLRLVRVMQANPSIGILQGLVLGAPSPFFFTRAIQFGMRHSIRPIMLGAAWWQADTGPFSGHNALIRMQPFHDHCLLAPIPGEGVLSGHVLSHDHIEAALMRRAGFACEVLVEEDESFEDNPPSLPDFIKREIRWCNGNMQYLRLLGLAGLTSVSRVNLAVLVSQYAGPTAWSLLIALGLTLPLIGSPAVGVPPAAGIAFLALILTLSLLPKIISAGMLLGNAAALPAYGGALRVFAAILSETLLSILMAPIAAFAVVLAVLRLASGRRMSWDAQKRERDRLRWSEALRSLWPQTLAGIVVAAYLLALAPGWAVWVAAPVWAPLALSVPLAVVTAMPALGRFCQWTGLFATPEERLVQPVGRSQVMVARAS